MKGKEIMGEELQEGEKEKITEEGKRKRGQQDNRGDVYGGLGGERIHCFLGKGKDWGGGGWGRREGCPTSVSLYISFFLTLFCFVLFSLSLWDF